MEYVPQVEQNLGREFATIQRHNLAGKLVKELEQKPKTAPWMEIGDPGLNMEHALQVEQ